MGEISELCFDKKTGPLTGRAIFNVFLTGHEFTTRKK